MHFSLGTRKNTLRSRCNNIESCKVHAYYTELGDPCPGISKMAMVVYYCHGTPTGRALIAIFVLIVIDLS